MISAPRSGISRNAPVGSRSASCGCGASWREGTGPLPDIVYLKLCKAFEDEVMGRANVLIWDAPLQIVS